MHNNDYNIALFIFFIPYILFEVPSNLVLKKLAPSTWLSLIMILWGIATVGMGLVNNFEGLIAMRVLLGFFEAGLFPGTQQVNNLVLIILVLTMEQAASTSSPCTTSVTSYSGV
jgi:MFS family permease